MCLKPFFWCFIAFAILACRQNPKKTQTNNIKQAVATEKSELKKDTLVWTAKFLHSNVPNCKGKNCNYVELLYPIFRSNPKLNLLIKNYILEYLDVDKRKSGSIDTFFKTFSNDFFSDSDINSDDGTSTFTSLYIVPITQDSSLIVIKLFNEMSGGAHPNSVYNFINWNTKNDTVISLNDLLVNGYNKEFTSIAEKIFRKNVDLSADSPLNDYNFDNGFALNDNFKITSKGLYFFYNAYEIQAYGFGPTELLIPYSKIKSLLKPHTVLAQYIN